MRVVAINGSPKGRSSVTFVMVEEILKGFSEHGWLSQQVVLSELNIHHCIGCFHCWKNQGSCIFKDDMQELIPFLDSEILVIASPLYCDNITGLMKNFLDRAVARANPSMGRDQNHESIHLSRKNRPKRKLIMLSNCGFSENTHFQVLNLWSQRWARNTGQDLIAEIYRSQGPLLLGSDTHSKNIADSYKALLREAGRELAHSQGLCEETQKKLLEPLIPHDVYIQEHNKIFAKYASA